MWSNGDDQHRRGRYIATSTEPKSLAEARQSLYVPNGTANHISVNLMDDAGYTGRVGGVKYTVLRPERRVGAPLALP